MEGKLKKAMTIYDTEWPIGTILVEVILDDRLGICAVLPDGHHVTHIKPDFIELNDE